MAPFYRVYMLQNAAGKLYIRLSDCVSRRVEQHNGGGSHYTRRKGPWMLRSTSAKLSFSISRKYENRRNLQYCPTRRSPDLALYLVRLIIARPRVQIPPPQPIFPLFGMAPFYRV